MLSDSGGHVPDDVSTFSSQHSQPSIPARPFQPPLTHHRSTPPPPPYTHPSTPISPTTTSHPTSSSMRPPTYDTSHSSSSSSSSSSRPVARRVSSQSDITHSSSRSSISNSTAPTSPSLSMHIPQRQWRPTPNVPLGLTSRHRARADNAEEERNRWLSEDEGLDGVARSIGRRRRRRSSDDEPPTGQSGPGDDTDRHPDRATADLGGPGPTTRQTRQQDKTNLTSPSGSGKVGGRPKPRRVRSYETARAGPSTSSSTIGAEDVTVGSNPPKIRDIAPGPTSPVTTMQVDVGERVFVAESGIEAMGTVPDYAVGRGGDGIGGIGMPSTGGEEEEVLSQRQEQDAMLHKLRRILGW